MSLPGASTLQLISDGRRLLPPLKYGMSGADVMETCRWFCMYSMSVFSGPLEMFFSDHMRDCFLPLQRSKCNNHN
jgi:hypothetical protein